MRRSRKNVSALVLAIAGLGCSSSGSSGDNVTCGPGTKLDGSVCYVAPVHVADAAAVPADATTSAGDAASDAPLGAASGDFAGVTAVAPASPTSVFFAWEPATEVGMADASAAFTYNV